VPAAGGLLRGTLALPTAELDETTDAAGPPAPRCASRRVAGRGRSRRPYPQSSPIATSRPRCPRPRRARRGTLRRATRRLSRPTTPSARSAISSFTRKTSALAFMTPESRQTGQLPGELVKGTWCGSSCALVAVHGVLRELDRRSPAGDDGQGEPFPPPAARERLRRLAAPCPRAHARASPTRPAAAAASAGSVPAPRLTSRARAPVLARRSAKGPPRPQGFVARHPSSGRGPTPSSCSRGSRCCSRSQGDDRVLEPLARRRPTRGVSSSAAHTMGLADARLGRFADARERLTRPFLPRAVSSGPGRRALVELRGALAETTAGRGDLPAALALWDGYAAARASR